MAAVTGTRAAARSPDRPRTAPGSSGSAAASDRARARSRRFEQAAPALGRRTQSVGRLPENLAEGIGAPQPPPEYIAEVATPSEDAWAREQAD